MAAPMPPPQGPPDRRRPFDGGGGWQPQVPKRARTDLQTRQHVVSVMKVFLNRRYSYSETNQVGTWDCPVCSAHFLLFETSESARGWHGILEIGFHAGGQQLWDVPATCGICQVEWEPVGL